MVGRIRCVTDEAQLIEAVRQQRRLGCVIESVEHKQRFEVVPDHRTTKARYSRVEVLVMPAGDDDGLTVFQDRVERYRMGGEASIVPAAHIAFEHWNGKVGPRAAVERVLHLEISDIPSHRTA